LLGTKPGPIFGGVPFLFGTKRETPVPHPLRGRRAALFAKGVQGDAELPLRHTDVSAHVSGSVSSTRVTQTFHNSHAVPIEAVYVFPSAETGGRERLPHDRREAADPRHDPPRDEAARI